MSGPAERLIEASPGIRLRVLEWPDPPAGASLELPVLFLPGWISHLDGWTGLISGLTAVCKLYCLETRDKASAGLAGRVSFAIQEQATDLEPVARALGLAPRRFHVAGSSTGANILLHYLLSGRHPPRSAALMLPMRAYRFPARGIPYLYVPHQVGHLLRPLIKAYIRRFRSDPSGRRSMLEYNFHSIDQMDLRRAQRSARDLQRYRFPAPVPRVDARCLVVRAPRDRMHAADVAEELAVSLGAELRDVGESGMVHSAAMAGELETFFARREQED